jgi:hypothetical protein
MTPLQTRDHYASEACHLPQAQTKFDQSTAITDPTLVQMSRKQMADMAILFNLAEDQQLGGDYSYYGSGDLQYRAILDRRGRPVLEAFLHEGTPYLFSGTDINQTLDGLRSAYVSTLAAQAQAVEREARMDEFLDSAWDQIDTFLQGKPDGATLGEILDASNAQGQDAAKQFLSESGIEAVGLALKTARDVTAAPSLYPEQYVEVARATQIDQLPG